MAIALLLPLLAAGPVTSPITDLLKPKWKTNIGLATYRTNIIHYSGQIILGSNGQHHRDYALDAGNGVYILDARTGKQVRHMAYENFGDMDVNGVAVDGSRLYFGSDNDEFNCYYTTGEKAWTVPVSGDVETAPLLSDINKDGQKDAIFATESGEIAALDGLTGKYLWSFKIKDFNGWKKTQNRYTFKVGDWFRDGYGFMDAPLQADLNQDGNLDVVALARDGYMYALDGLNGKLLWRVKHDGYRSMSPVVAHVGGKPRFYLMVQAKEGNSWMQRLTCVDADGNIVFKSRPLGVQPSYQPTIIGHEMVLASYDSVFAVNIVNGAVRGGKLHENKSYYYGHTITAAPLLLDLLALGSPQLVFFGQRGTVTLVDWKSLVRLREFEMPYGTETTPLLTDVDCDGRLDILISDYNGYLHCYGTPITEKASALARR